MNTQRKSDLKHHLYKTQRKLLHVFLAGVILTASLLVLAGALNADFVSYRSDYESWYATVVTEEHLVALDFLTELETYSTSRRGNSYGVAYRGTADFGDCVYLYDLCMTNEIDTIVVAQTTLPNGIRHWLKLTRDDLYQMLYDDSGYYDVLSGDGIKCSTNLSQTYVKLGLSARLHALIFRLFQDNVLLTSCTLDAWNNGSIIVILVFCLILWAFIFVPIAKRLNRRIRRLERQIDHLHDDTAASESSREPLITLIFPERSQTDSVQDSEAASDEANPANQPPSPQ